MTNNDFFNKEQAMETPEAQEIQTISLGEKEYSQEELQKLVGLGEKAVELETKWNTPINSLMPEYTKVTQTKAEQEKRIAELEAQVQEAVSTATQKKLAEGETLTYEEQQRVAREEAKKLGLVTSDDFDKYYNERKEKEVTESMAKQLISDVNTFVEKQSSEGKPKISTKELIEAMDERGVGDYEYVYTKLFEKEVDDWKLKQLSSNKPSSFYTQTTSSAGAKVPEERRVTSDNLSAVIDEVLARHSR